MPNQLPPPPRRHRRRPAADKTRCRKHREQHQPPGVCSACLREKLSQLPSVASSSSSSYYRTDDTSSSPSSASSYYSSSSSSCDSSTCTSPRKGGGGGMLMSLSSRLVGKKNNRVETTSFMMSKSRSMGLGCHAKGGGVEGGKVVKGFWSRVLRRGKRSSTTEEEQRGIRPPTTLGGRSITMRDVVVLHA